MSQLPLAASAPRHYDTSPITTGTDLAHTVTDSHSAEVPSPTVKTEDSTDEHCANILEGPTELVQLQDPHLPPILALQ